MRRLKLQDLHGPKHVEYQTANTHLLLPNKRVTQSPTGFGLIHYCATAVPTLRGEGAGTESDVQRVRLLYTYRSASIRSPWWRPRNIRRTGRIASADSGRWPLVCRTACCRRRDHNVFTTRSCPPRRPSSNGNQKKGDQRRLPVERRNGIEKGKRSPVITSKYKYCYFCCCCCCCYCYWTFAKPSNISRVVREGPNRGREVRRTVGGVRQGFAVGFGEFLSSLPESNGGNGGFQVGAHEKW